jgi:3-dehydroquinate synthase
MQLDISSRGGNYTVAEIATVAEAAAAATASATRGVMLADARVTALHPTVLAGSDPARTFLIEANEEAKSLSALEPLILNLLRAGVRRDTELVVVGGGVLQDIGCFVASTLLRGIPWRLVPTTLLAQADSCIGSKSSINVGSFKNQLGTFYPPAGVWLAFDVLATLPADEVRSGLGEVIKLHLVAGPAEAERVRGRLDQFQRDGTGLPEMVWDSLTIKKGYIEQDELDTGRRNLLNYGHTFGHAFESVTRYAIPHGIAVTLGVAAATFFSERLGMLPAGEFDALNAFLRPWYEPYQNHVRAADSVSVLIAMRKDKKNMGDGITFILTRGPGAMEKVQVAADRAAALYSEFAAALGR